MGKHKKKSKKHKDKCKSKSKRQRREQRSSSSSEEEWVEKKLSRSSSSEENYGGRTTYPQPQERKRKCDFEAGRSDETEESIRENCIEKREDWMSLPASFLTSSNSDRKQERNESKRLEREKQQYDPRRCSRELNPYWKDGGDGLPKFIKPDLDDGGGSSYAKKKQATKTSNWRKTREVHPASSSTKETLLITDTENSDINLKNSADVSSEKALNVLAAKLVKAEIMGNTKLATELKAKLEEARSLQEKKLGEQEEILLTHTDSKGRSQPVKTQTGYGEPSDSHKKRKNVETHKDGERVRYFADDDEYSLKQMFEKERNNSAVDQNSEFVRMASKIRKNDDLDDIFADNIRKKESDSKANSRFREKAINEHQKVIKSLDNCNKCIQSDMMLKHLMVSMKETVYLALPAHEPLTEGHCLIIPIRHTPCSTQLDENEWAELVDMRKALVNLFKSRNEELIFFEIANSLHKFPHMCIECIPMPKEDGDMAPVYFKKAIDESETEWAQNKKLVSLKGRDVRKAIPKGLPYFFVSFGMEEGFAHVIEDEHMFPKNFAQEIIGGILDLHHSKWRKPKRQSFDEQSKRVVTFSKDWKEFDPD